MPIKLTSLVCIYVITFEQLNRSAFLHVWMYMSLVCACAEDWYQCPVLVHFPLHFVLTHKLGKENEALYYLNCLHQKCKSGVPDSLYNCMYFTFIVYNIVYCLQRMLPLRMRQQLQLTRCNMGLVMGPVRSRRSLRQQGQLLKFWFQKCGRKYRKTSDWGPVEPVRVRTRTSRWAEGLC